MAYLVGAAQAVADAKPLQAFLGVSSSAVGASSSRAAGVRPPELSLGESDGYLTFESRRRSIEAAQQLTHVLADQPRYSGGGTALGAYEDFEVFISGSGSDAVALPSPSISNSISGPPTAIMSPI